MTNAAGIVIAPSIEVAEYMADILEILEDQRPAIVHNQVKNPDAKIAAFCNSNKKWIVSVAMISEGTDIKRARVLVYLPNARTELSFRQAMGRVVRTMGNDDMSRAYVVMPAHPIFELYAKRVEDEMGVAPAKDTEPATKSCPICEEKTPLSKTNCDFCGYEWPEKVSKLRSCHECEGLNPVMAKE